MSETAEPLSRCGGDGEPLVRRSATASPQGKPGCLSLRRIIHRCPISRLSSPVPGRRIQWGKPPRRFLPWPLGRSRRTIRKVLLALFLFRVSFCRTKRNPAAGGSLNESVGRKESGIVPRQGPRPLGAFHSLPRQRDIKWPTRAKTAWLSHLYYLAMWPTRTCYSAMWPTSTNRVVKPFSCYWAISFLPDGAGKKVPALLSGAGTGHLQALSP